MFDTNEHSLSTLSQSRNVCQFHRHRLEEKEDETAAANQSSACDMYGFIKNASLYMMKP